MHRRLFILAAIILILIAAGLCLANETFRGSVDTTPQWMEQKQEATLIPQGKYIALQADGFAASSLHQAVLSTNETGTWENETTSALFWTQTAVQGFDNFGTATYKDGVLYAPSKGDNNLYAVNASNGAMIWNTTVRQCDGSPCIDGDVVYVGECAGVYGEPTPLARAMALNRTNGQEIWQFTEPHNCTWVGSPLVKDDYVYYTTSYYDTSYFTIGCGVYALNKTNGDVLWRQDVGNIIGSAAYDNETIYTSVYNPPGQYAFNATTGQQLWNQTYGRSWDTSPVICDGMIIQVEYNSTERLWSTYVLNETDGQFIRRFQGKGSTATPLVHDGKVFIPSNDWRMWAFDLATGTELWQTVPIHDGFLQNYTYCSPASAGSAIYCQALNGTFYAINQTDGSVLWSYTMASTGFGSPSIGDGYVFITNDGGLYAFKIGPGSGDWPMFCQNPLHTSDSDQGIEYVRWPLTQPQYLGDLPNTWITAKFIWCNKTIASAAIAWKIYFFDGIGNSNVTESKIFYVNVPLHDVAIVNIVPNAATIEQNQTLPINVTASNLGNYTETCNITLYCDSAEVCLQSLTLNPWDSQTLTLTWNTTGTSAANHTLKVVASTIPGETNVQNNIYTMSYPITIVPEFQLATVLLAVFMASTLFSSILVKKKKRLRKP